MTSQIHPLHSMLSSAHTIAAWQVLFPNLSSSPNLLPNFHTRHNCTSLRISQPLNFKYTLDSHLPASLCSQRVPQTDLPSCPRTPSSALLGHWHPPAVCFSSFRSQSSNASLERPFPEHLLKGATEAQSLSGKNAVFSVHHTYHDLKLFCRFIHDLYSHAGVPAPHGQKLCPIHSQIPTG